MSISIIIVTHDSQPELMRLLESIERHLAALPQVVVVDNDSADGGPDAAARWGAQVIRLPRNIGFGAANNRGLEHAHHDVCALLNPDIELLDAGLLELAAVARRRRALLVPRLLNDDGSRQRSAHPLPGQPRAMLPALLPPRLLPSGLRLEAEPWRSDAPRPVGWAIAAAVVAQRELLSAIGPFDPGTFLFFEDLELCLRARSAGAPTIFDPRRRMRHSGGHSTTSAYRGEPHELMAQRRRQVVRQELGSSSLRWDDAAQATTFAVRLAARRLLRRDASRERSQLNALRTARRR